MSSSEIAVSVRGLSKSYTIAHESQKHTLASEALIHNLKNIGRKSETETFWALKDVSFDIKKGDVTGVVGRNGAGKSTLLKVLSRITEPTSGQIELYGRVGSLLEVGTGFHPELTGRENVYLNGSILGMNRREIAKHFDAIVDFAGVEKFLDTPVKRYSSGMYVRLAFAVAAYLESDILVIDEVLAVGDVEFQKKCLGKMQDVASHGRTVIFVSHNEAVIRRLCTSAILLEAGQVNTIGTPDEVFLNYRAQRIDDNFSDKNRTISSEHIQIVDAYLSVDGVRATEMAGRHEPVLSITVDVRSAVRFAPEIVIRDASSTPIMFASIWYSRGVTYTLDPGTHTLSYHLPLPPLACGKYSLDLLLVDPCIQFFEILEEAIVFNVNSSDSPATGFQFKQSLGRGAIFLESYEVEPLTEYDVPAELSFRE